jgi:hypothetical protein
MAEHCESVLDAAGPVRSSSLGALSRLNDKTLLRIFTFFTPNVLLTASRVSWMFWALQDDDYLWRVLALLLLIDDDKKLGLFTFHGSWKATMLHPARYPNRSWDEQVKPPPLQGFVRDSPGAPHSLACHCAIRSGGTTPATKTSCDGRCTSGASTAASD